MKLADITTTAYPMLSMGRWHIGITTPNGTTTRLLANYSSRAEAEAAITALGYTLRLRPVTTLMRHPSSNNDDN